MSLSQDYLYRTTVAVSASISARHRLRAAKHAVPTAGRPMKGGHDTQEVAVKKPVPDTPKPPPSDRVAACHGSIDSEADSLAGQPGDVALCRRRPFGI